MIVRAFRCGVTWVAPVEFRPRMVREGYRVFPSEPGDPVVTVPTMLSDAVEAARTHASAPSPPAEESAPIHVTVRVESRKKRRGKR